MMAFDEMSEAAKRKMNEFTNAQKRILEELADGEVHHFSTGQAGIPMSRLHKLQYVRQVAKGDWQITELGKAVVEGGVPTPLPAEDRPAAEPYQPMTPVLTPKVRPFTPPDGPPHVPTAPTANGRDDLPVGEECEGCIRRKVLDLLVESMPEAKELYALLVRQEMVINKLKGRNGG